MKEYTTEEIFNELWKRIEFDANVSEELATESNELQDRINKAIEYIENNWIEYSDFQYVDNDDELNIDCESIKELLDILKGDFKRHIDRINELTNRIDKAIRILNSAKNHYDNDKTNWAIERTLRVLKGSDKE